MIRSAAIVSLVATPMLVVGSPSFSCSAPDASSPASLAMRFSQLVRPG